MTNGKDALRRIKVAAGLRELASALERNIDLPVPPRVEITYPVIGQNDEAERAEVDRIGRILGEIPSEEWEGHHYAVTRNFGPVTYTATAITREWMARYCEKWRAAESYAREKWGDV
ncbi:hypothetical protein E1264_34505 [Actinomadura sp. KC216]|uniref:hypothetical protein n=1 Tax=Actinomadura sp. KC216 TaxID=2530370 RepID=UPI0010478531|nr:hypothetical protein [Actinomadura sp. KC216]TDB80186.1 hypothetical protein E1264_34505 [Actinomadura sp. KC216]